MKTNKIVIGILAHVDAGKTTLSENMLYTSKSIRTLGRVDHKNTLLDNFDVERERGITVFSKQAELTLGKFEVTLLDTPGHTDFSAEMERTLQVLDYAILVISGPDGVTGHTLTLWKLLERYNIPTFIFINKMDQPGIEPQIIMEDISNQLTGNCVNMSVGITNDNIESIAMCSETLTDTYLNEGIITEEDIRTEFGARNIFLCYFGSALKGDGLDELYKGMASYMDECDYGDEYGARVYKIGRDNNGARLTYVKVTGGTLKTKMNISNNTDDEEHKWNEKIDQIRIYFGGQYNTVNEATAGTICVLTGLKNTRAGDAIGALTGITIPVIEPVLSYRVTINDDLSPNAVLPKLRELEDEEPQLNITYDSRIGEIHAKVMGDVQMEILKDQIMDRYGIDVTFDTGNVVYKETVKNRVEGIGHFEPLKHYAEVYVIVEPLERGSGVQCYTNCSEDELDKNWQRLILTHMEEKQHIGVLTGSEITDIAITLVAGRAHKKHTEGGDFRQATYRAIRNALAKAESILLEPVYQFQIEVPMDYVGRVMTDVERMHGECRPPQMINEKYIINGVAPVVTMNGYQREIISYTRGLGKINCVFGGYRECHNSEDVIESFNYDFTQDTMNPASSVFCAHGAGYVVDWDEVGEHAHVECVLDDGNNKKNEDEYFLRKHSVRSVSEYCTTEELEEIFERTYGTIKKERAKWTKSTANNISNIKKRDVAYLEDNRERYLLVDGYNIIFAWEDLNELSRINLEAARNALMDILCNYQGYKKEHVILVFDAYKVKGNPGEVIKYNNIDVIYTKEAETADTYIEKTSHELGKKYRVTVATSDALEQCIIWGNGAMRMSAREFREQIDKINEEIRTYIN